MRPALTTLLSALVAALALAACGSASDTRQDFIARADAICQTAFRQTSAATVVGESGSPSLYLRRVVPVVEAEVRDILALPRPTQDAPLLRRYLTALRDAGMAYLTLAEAAKTGDGGAFDRAEAALSANPTRVLATRYGLEACAGQATVGSG